MKQVNNPSSLIDPSRARMLLEKWGGVLDAESKTLKPITDKHTRQATAMLLENQEQFLMEANTAGSGGVFGTSQTGTGWGPAGTPGTDAYATGDSRIPKILIPMIRRTFPELITNEIVGVQPMSGPVGLAFALRYKYNSDVLGNGVDSNGHYTPQGKFTPADTLDTNSKSASGGDGQNIGYGSGALAGNKAEMGWQLLDTRFTGASAGYLSGVEASALSAKAGYDLSATPLKDGLKFADQDKGIAALLQNYEITGNIPTVDITFEKTSIEAGTRRLAARYSLELEQDLKNMNGIEADTEFVNAMSYEIQAEIDREVIVRMLQVTLNSGNISFWSPATADARWIMERNRDFYQKLVIEANNVAIRNRRGAANFIVTTPRVCAILEALPEFQFAPVQGSVNTNSIGVAKVGNLGGRFNVYRDTRSCVQDGGFGGPAYGSGNLAQIDYALLGYKGSEYFDTGLIYCPYIPVMLQRTIGPNDFAPRIGVMTRYGIVSNIFGSDLYYSLVIVNGLGKEFTEAGKKIYF